jgi:hypothetical protein
MPLYLTIRGQHKEVSNDRLAQIHSGLFAEVCDPDRGLGLIAGTGCRASDPGILVCFPAVHLDVLRQVASISCRSWAAARPERISSSSHLLVVRCQRIVLNKDS